MMASSCGLLSSSSWTRATTSAETLLQALARRAAASGTRMNRGITAGTLVSDLANHESAVDLDEITEELHEVARGVLLAGQWDHELGEILFVLRSSTESS